MAKSAAILRRVDARTGKTLYRFHTNDSWRATPMTYSVDGRQYIAGMDGQILWAFALGHEQDVPEKKTSPGDRK